MHRAQPILESGLKWYCVRTQPKKERSAAAILGARFGLDVFAPQIRFQRKTVRGLIWFQESLFPGYIFVRFDLREMKRSVMHAPGVLNLPVFGGKIIAVPSQVIEQLQDELSGKKVVEASVPFKVGDETTIMDGAMRGLQVKVIELLPAQQRVMVLMELLGTQVQSVFPVEALEHRQRHPMAVE